MAKEDTKTNQREVDGVDLVNWDEAPEYPEDPTEEKRENKYPPRMEMKEGIRYQFRILGDVRVFRMHFDPFIAIVGKKEEDDPAWMAGNVPKLRYCAYIWDRGEEDIERRFKSYEFGGLFYKKLKEHYELTGANPGKGPQAPDWVMRFKDPVDESTGKKNSHSRDYSVTVVPAVPLTDEESAVVKACLEKYPSIPELKKPLDPKIVAEMWEESKTLKAGDPKPGSGKWWKARREADGNGGETEQRRPEPSSEERSQDVADLLETQNEDEGGGETKADDDIPW